MAHIYNTGDVFCFFYGILKKIDMKTLRERNHQWGRERKIMLWTTEVTI